MDNKDSKKMPFKRIFMIILMYLIPFVNITVVLSNYTDNTKMVVSICSVLASTAAASACTIKAVRDEIEKLSIAQPFALVLSMGAFICCLSYEVYEKMLLNIWIVGVFTIIANGIAIYMFCISDKAITELVSDYTISEEDIRKAKELEQKAESMSGKKTSSSGVNVTKKGGRK